ncbi:MAG: sigma-70 family RNA polymerase sigma factor [Bacilli bacterium]|nr:sigma-70 family RNA polymerase sigma factor [Bacilli bacterium]
MQAREALEERNVADPSLYEIAEEMDVPIGEVVCALDAISTPMSLYEPISGEGADSLLVMDSLTSDKNPEEGWTENIDLATAISELPEQEREVLRLRYYCGRTQIEVSAALGISQAQVSRLENGAIKRLKCELAE